MTGKDDRETRTPHDDDFSAAALDALHALLRDHDNARVKLADIGIVSELSYDTVKAAGGRFVPVSPALALHVQQLAEILVAVASHEQAPAEWVEVAHSAVRALKAETFVWRTEPAPAGEKTKRRKVVRREPSPQLQPWVHILERRFLRLASTQPPANPDETVGALLETLDAEAHDAPAQFRAPNEHHLAAARKVIGDLIAAKPNGSRYWRIADLTHPPGGRGRRVTAYGAAERFAHAFGATMPRSASTALR